MSSISANPIFPRLKFTQDNCLSDVIRFIKGENIMVLYENTNEKICRVFFTIFFDQSLQSLRNTRVVYLNCSALPELLQDGQWELEIKNAIKDVIELEPGALKDTILQQNDEEVPHRLYAEAD